eukprot:3052048-Pyramimonas_sp.AAC.1
MALLAHRATRRYNSLDCCPGQIKAPLERHAVFCTQRIRSARSILRGAWSKDLKLLRGNKPPPPSCDMRTLLQSYK